MPHRGSRWRRVILVLVVQLLVTVGILEVALRLARPHHPGLRALLYTSTVVTEYDSATTTRELLELTVLGFSPGLDSAGFRLSSRGFRTPEYTPEPPPGTSRIVVLGDSFAFASGGLPWSLLWTTRLEGELEQRGVPAEVVSLGVPAVGPRFLARLWQLEGAALEPEVALVAFFVGNDFTDDFDQPMEVTSVEGLARWSLTVRLVRNLSRLWRERRAGAARWAPSSPGAADAWPPGTEQPGYVERWRTDARLRAGDGRYTEDAYLEIEEGRLRLVRDDHRETFERFAGQVEEVLSALAASVRRHGATPVLVIVPDEYQVNDDLRHRILERYDVPPANIDVTLPQRRLLAWCQSRGVPCLDLLPVLRAAEQQGEPTYQLRDSHWNPAGNRRVAEAVARFLVGTGLVAPSAGR